MITPGSPAAAKVLLVDDEAQQLAARAQALNMSGFSVITACGPLESIFILAEGATKIDVAILDYDMPAMNGCILARCIKGLCPWLKIILYSAAVGIPRVQMASIDAFVSKGEGIGPLIAQVMHFAPSTARGGRASIGLTGAYFQAGARILIADDNALMLSIVAELLGKRHNVVGTVRDGLALLDGIAKLSPDVAVVDIGMPQMHGFEVAKRIRSSGRGPSLVYLTVYENAEFVRSALSVGVLGYVVKCHLLTDLPMAVEAALNGQQFLSPSLQALVSANGF